MAVASALSIPPARVDMQAILQFLHAAETFAFEYEPTCAICDDGFLQDDLQLQGECGHHFHDECLDLWTMACFVKHWDHECPACGATIRVDDLEK